jgi:3-oxoacyl-[acyl-carrier protein] reductase
VDQSQTKSVAIIGATGGIGSALAREMRNHRLCLIARRETMLQELAAEVRAESVTLTTDEGVFGGIDRALKSATEKLGRLDGVVSVAGTFLLKPAHLTSEAEWQDLMSSQVTTAFATIRSSARILMDQGGGSITLISSAAAQIGLPNHEAIAAAKSAIEGLVRSAAATYARQGIRVNAVAPGLVATPMTSKITASAPALEASLALHPLGRVGTAEEIAKGIRFTIECEWMTGQVLGIDGGLGRLKAPARPR